MYLSDYPLDWEFTDEYLDNRPEIPEGEFPEYWIAVPVDKVLPSGVPYEILEELYIPEEDPVFNNIPSESEKGYTRKGEITDHEDLLMHLLNEAYTLTGNEKDLLNTPKKVKIEEAEDETYQMWIFGARWWPSGTIKIWDDNVARTHRPIIGYTTTYEYEELPCNNGNSEGEDAEDYLKCPKTKVTIKTPIYGTPVTKPGKYIPLRGAQVLMRQWFTVRQGITDQNGYFKTSSVRGSARYILQWERYEYSIRNGWISQAETRGPKLKKQGWYLHIKGGTAEYYGHIHRAAHHYYYGNIKGLRQPPKNSFWKTQTKIRAYLQSGGDCGSSSNSAGCHSSGWRAFGLYSPIKIYTYQSPTIQTYATTIHELTHSSHWNMNRSAFRSSESKVKESWARGVQWELTRMIYPDYRGGATILPNYTQVVVDMIDDDFKTTQPSTNRGHHNSTKDQVSGYTIKQIEDALNGQKNWNSWRDNIKNKYNNPTESHLDKLFKNYE